MMPERMMVMMVKPATHVPSTSATTTTVQDGPFPTPPTLQQDQVELAAEGEVVSRREVPRRVQVDHPPLKDQMATREGGGVNRSR
jgi:hypothetical protein